MGSYESFCKCFEKHKLFPVVAETLHSYQKCIKAPISQHPCQHFLFLIVFFVVISVWEERHLIVLFICICLKTKDVKHFSTQLMTIFIFEEIPIQVIHHFM